MPQKIRRLKAALSRAGCYVRPGKGSHTVWKHASLLGVEITLAGKDGDGAKPYQERDVKILLRQLERRGYE